MSMRYDTSRVQHSGKLYDRKETRRENRSSLFQNALILDSLDGINTGDLLPGPNLNGKRVGVILFIFLKHANPFYIIKDSSIISFSRVGDLLSDRGNF